MYKLVVSDLDETLLTSEKRVGLKTREAIQQAKNKAPSLSAQPAAVCSPFREPSKKSAPGIRLESIRFPIMAA